MSTTSFRRLGILGVSAAVIVAALATVGYRQWRQATGSPIAPIASHGQSGTSSDPAQSVAPVSGGPDGASHEPLGSSPVGSEASIQERGAGSGVRPSASGTPVAADGTTKDREVAATALEATRADRDDLRNLASAADKTLRDTQAELRAMTAAAERQQTQNATLRYVIGSKAQLVKSKVIDGNLRLLPAKTAGSAFVASGGSKLPPIDPSTYGLKRTKRVTILPGLVAESVDYQVQNVEGFVSISILRPERFSQYAKYFVVVLE